MKYDLNSKSFDSNYSIGDKVTIDGITYKIKASPEFNACSKCSFKHADSNCMRIGSCFTDQEQPVHFKKVEKKQKNKKLIDMIDEKMESVDRLMSERDYDGAACQLSDLVWTIREKLYIEIIKKGRV